MPNKQDLINDIHRLIGINVTHKYLITLYKLVLISFLTLNNLK